MPFVIIRDIRHRASELPGGRNAKLLLLKMSYDGCSVLILDESPRNFSPLSGPVIRNVLKAFSGAIINIPRDRKPAAYR